MLVNLLILITSTCLGSTMVRAGVADFLAYGDLRGYIEPCGCDPSTDLGGIKRLGIALSRERRLRPDVLVLDLGNNLPLRSESKLKTPYLIAASAQLGPGATLMNQLELERLPEIEEMHRREPGSVAPYLLSNALPARARSVAVKDVRSGKGWVALGYTYVPELRARLERVGPNLIKSWQKRLVDIPRDQRILLFAGPGEDLQTILRSNLFATVISSNTSSLETVVGPEERLHPEQLVRLKDPQVLMVALGGQGIIRGGALQFSEAKPLAAYLTPVAEKSARVKEDAAWLRSPNLVTWLVPGSGDDEGPLQPLYLRYSEATKQAFRGQSAERLKQLKETPYAGVQACQGCHSEQTAIYFASKHAHAMKTLQDKGKHEDGACISCHVVGAKATGGFVSMEASPQLANVQCENCHGPRLAHTRDPRIKGPSSVEAKAVCSGCHNSQHSPKFKFASYWDEIKHGKNK